MIFLENRRLFLENFNNDEKNDTLSQKEKIERKNPLDEKSLQNQHFMEKLLQSLSQKMSNLPQNDQEWAREGLGKTRDTAGNYLAKLGPEITQKMMREIPREKGEKITNRHFERIKQLLG